MRDVILPGSREAAPVPTPTPQKSDNFLKLVITGLVCLVLLGFGGAIYFYQHTRDKLSENVAVESPLDSAKLIEEIGKLILLPEGEAPTVATVANLEPLKDQPFFVHAQLGDRVVIYNEAKRAYLYRPTEHRLIEVSSVTLQPE